MASDHLIELANRIDFPERLKWVYLGAYNMSLHLAVYQDGNVLVVSGGDRYPGELGQLGFSKSRGEWVRQGHQFSPSEFRHKFPTSTSFETSCVDVLIDRTDEVFYVTSKLATDPRSVRLHSVNGSVTSQEIGIDWPLAKKDTKLQIWLAEAHIGPHELRGFGLTPEAAMTSLVDGWVDHCAREHIDPTFLSKYRDSVAVCAADIGSGYVRGVGDTGWHNEIISGDHERFENILSKVANLEPVAGRDGYGLRR
jgi:hypothetical protein